MDLPGSDVELLIETHILSLLLPLGKSNGTVGVDWKVRKVNLVLELSLRCCRRSSDALLLVELIYCCRKLFLSLQAYVEKEL